MPKEVVSTSGMSTGAMLAWWIANFVTCGLSYPLYRVAKHHADRTTRTKIA